MRGVIPYVSIKGADAAIAFYIRAFGAVQHGEAVRHPDGRILNAGLEINGGMMMVMDAFPEHGVPTTEPANHGFTLQLVITDGDFWWSRAVEAGCEIKQDLKLEFWGDRYGRVRDPFGLEWAFNEPAVSKR
jgi:PhnB protein